MRQVSPQNDGQRSFQLALARLQEYRLAQRQVRRVMVGRKGAILIEAEQEGRRRFLVFESGNLTETLPQDDAKIPLSVRLGGGGAFAADPIVSYRPGSRMVLEPSSSSGDTMIKAYRKHRTRSAEEKYLIAVAATESGGFDVPGLLRVDQDDDYLLLQKRRGSPPGILPGAERVWMRVGTCLRQFQAYAPPGAMNGFTVADELAVLDERARRFQLFVADLPDGWLQGRERLDVMAASLPPATTGLTHRDLHDRQMIVDGQAICLLDFDLLCAADVALDPANLLAHMNLRVMQAGEAGTPELQACRSGFLRGLGRHDEEGFEARVLFYEASTFLRLALLYALRPRWWHLTPLLIAQARDRLSVMEETGAST